MTQLKGRLANLFNRIGYMWLWLLLSAVLLMAVALINPVLIGSYIWAASKVCMAAVIGYGFDWAAFRGADPGVLEGIEKAMAQTRRATLMAAAMLAAGLIG